MKTVDERRQREERRTSDRRDSPRVLRELTVSGIEPATPAAKVAGEIGLGGASWVAPEVPGSGVLEVRFRLPELSEEVVARSESLRTEALPDGQVLVRARFAPLELPAELALARFLENAERIGEALKEGEGPGLPKKA